MPCHLRAARDSLPDPPCCAVLRCGFTQCRVAARPHLATARSNPRLWRDPRLGSYWAADGIRVNSLSPGPFPGTSAPKGLVERLCSKLPMGRMGEPNELSGALILLASEAGSFITGQNLVVDGGWTAW